MSTNYYIRENICECCNRYDETHIWKSSMWRDFTIRHHTEKYNSWNEFQNYLKERRIFDEYGEEDNVEDLIDFIKQKAIDHPFRHRQEEYDPHWKYIDWYYFLDVNFS